MKRLKLFSLILLLLVSCAPNTYLPTPAEMNYYAKGIFMECQMQDKTKLEGELLALNETEAFLLPRFGEVFKVSRQNMKSAILHVSLTANNPEELEAGPYIPILTISHGWWLIFTLPINLLVVGPTVGTHRSGTYVVEYPKIITWEQMTMYARFPQGIPEGVDILSYKGKTSYK